jgi:hypothetical protein
VCLLPALLLTHVSPRLHTTRALQTTSTYAITHAIPQPHHDSPEASPTPQVQGELDIMLDLINTLEQQQFLSITHVVARPLLPKEQALTAAAQLAARRCQLQGVSASLAQGGAVLAAEMGVAERFIADLAAIRRQGWKLTRRPGTLFPRSCIAIHLCIFTRGMPGK